MSSSAAIIIAEDDHHPVIFYNAYDGGIADYSAQYDKVIGVGMTLYEMLQGYQKTKKIPHAERAANEYFLLMNGSCRIADCIHPDVEYIYVMQFKNDIQSELRTCKLNAYMVTPWNFTQDPSFFKIRTWLSEKIPELYFEKKFFVRQIGSEIKKALREREKSTTSQELKEETNTSD